MFPVLCKLIFVEEMLGLLKSDKSCSGKHDKSGKFSILSMKLKLVRCHQFVLKFRFAVVDEK